KKTYTPNIIPDGYKVKPNSYGAALYQIIPSRKDSEPDKERFITTTIPEINTRYEIKENMNKKTYTPNIIPDGYKVKPNSYGAALYQIIPSRKD
ncbi:hypothetical protein EDM29_15765, partial [Staphylococcus aureus]